MSQRYEKKSRTRVATCIPIDAAKMRAVLNRKMVTQVAISEMIGRASAWMGVMLNKGSMNMYAMDEVARELGMTFEELFEEVVDRETWLDI